MGKKHRENRKNVKAMFRRADLPKGWRENEFGELVFRGHSKTNARRILLYNLYILKSRQFDLVKIAQQRAIEAIQEMEDAMVFNAISAALSEREKYDEASYTI